MKVIAGVKRHRCVGGPWEATIYTDGSVDMQTDFGAMVDADRYEALDTAARGLLTALGGSMLRWADPDYALANLHETLLMNDGRDDEGDEYVQVDVYVGHGRPVTGPEHVRAFGFGPGVRCHECRPVYVRRQR